MKHLAIIFVMMFALIGGDVFARGGRSSSSRSSSSRSSVSRSSSSNSRSTNRSSTVRSSSRRQDPAVAPNRTNSTVNRSNNNRSTSATNSRSTTPSNRSTTASRSTSTNRNDRAMARQNARTNNAASQRYGSRTNASAAYSRQLASRNSYTSATAPTTRPRHIPATTSVGGRNVNVSYNVLPGGGYGYGYISPTTGLFVALAANQMYVNNAMLASAGYGSYNANGQPQTVVYRDGPGAGFIILMIILVFGVIGIIAWKLQ